MTTSNFQRLGILHLFISIASATVTCITNLDCERTLRPGSFCVQGVCDNPFARGGCLKQLLPEWHNVRVCGSDDSQDAVTRGDCRSPQMGLDYTEIRIHAQNWESAFFHAWILQIILSEVLYVPVSIETGMPDKRLDFYDHDMPFDYGVGYDLNALRNAQEIGDCRLLRRSPDQHREKALSEGINDGAYVSCCHVIPEVGDGLVPSVMQMERDGVIEAPHGMGAIGQLNWFIPKFTGQRDPTLFHYLGIQGEVNRRKLAETFLRPTSWKDYCELASPTNCTLPTSTALRPPADEIEGARYFVEGLYTGFFRKTEQNNCDEHPTNCTGHIVDFPCGWSSYVFQQAAHLNIALESNGPEDVSGGYSYGQMIEIWAAANATRSNVMMLWWTPEALFQNYLGTDAEFQRVALPPPTQECINARVDIGTRCAGTLEERMGNPLGTCDSAPFPLLRIVTRNLFTLGQGTTLSLAQYSPAYDAIRAFTFSGLQIDTIFSRWAKRGKDKWNYDPRDAVCTWVVDNLEHIKSIVPRSYPRVVHHDMKATRSVLFVGSITISCVAIVMVLVCMIFTYRYREKRCMVYAQPEFLAMLLTGLLMVSLGALILAIPPTNATCTLSTWLTNMGYTLELVPLVVKIAAINQIMNAARKMRRVKVDRYSLVGVVIVLSLMVVVFLVLWTILDRPSQATNYQLTSQKTAFDETIVKASSFCKSASDAWSYMSIVWHTLLLVCATVLAFQTRKIQHEVNEAQTLAFMIYSHFVFVVLRVMVFMLSGVVDVSRIPRYFSLVFGVDVIATCFIYFVPKFAEKEDADRRRATLYSGVVMPSSFGYDNDQQIGPSSGHSRMKPNREAAKRENEEDDASSDFGGERYNPISPRRNVQSSSGTLDAASVNRGSSNDGNGADRNTAERPNAGGQTSGSLKGSTNTCTLDFDI